MELSFPIVLPLMLFALPTAVQNHRTHATALLISPTGRGAPLIAKGRLTQDKGVVGDRKAALLSVCWEASRDSLFHRINLMAHRLKEHSLAHAMHNVST